MSALLEDKFMRVLLMFDVPTKTKKEQKYAAKFRNELIKLGFFMMQFSVYMRICKGIVSAKAVVSRVRGILPPVGNVRSLIITEKQFDNMQILLGSAGFNESVNDDKNLVLFEFDEKIGDYRYLPKSEQTMEIEPNFNEKICDELDVSENAENLGKNLEKNDFWGQKNSRNFKGKRRKKDDGPSLFEF